MQENRPIFLMKVLYNVPYSNFLLFYYIKVHLPNIDKKLNRENITLKWKSIYDLLM